MSCPLCDRDDAFDVAYLLYSFVDCRLCPSKGYFIRKSGSPGSLAVLFAMIFSAGFLSSIVYPLFLGFCAHWRFIGFSLKFLAAKVPGSSVSAWVFSCVDPSLVAGAAMVALLCSGDFQQIWCSQHSGKWVVWSRHGLFFQNGLWERHGVCPLDHFACVSLKQVQWFSLARCCPPGVEHDC